MPMNADRKALGALGEEMAVVRLRKLGYKILARNVRLPGGEIDVVARQRDTLVIVEVRTRASSQHGTPEESVGPRKKEKLRQLALSYAQMNGLSDVAIRIDVVAIEMENDGSVGRMDVIQNAVEAD